ncbi:hypothetical protein LCGC14_2561280 [marine sediment metagenome]|uniref:Lon proteolytic domain-containing protein n=1 Tax=marine sediment metagenome TaxID=412755 RepID=A0A0F9CW79_9ZZZZ
MYKGYMEQGSFSRGDEKGTVSADAKTTSGLIKLIHPDGVCSREEMQEYLTLALELRRRVKEQLKRMGGIEYSKVNFSYIDKRTGQETFITCKELGAIQVIPDTPLEPGDIFTVGYDDSEGRYSLFRIQIQTNQGGHRFNVVGTSGKGIKESARMSYDYLKANASRMGIDRDLSSYDTNIQVISLMQAKDAEDLGVVFFVGLVSALMGRPLVGGLVVLAT